MRKALVATLSALAIALPYAGPAAAATTPKPKTVKKVTTKSYTGPAGTAGRWGTVQVTIVVKTTTLTTGTKKKVTRTITDAKSAYEVHTDRSQFIMEQALPLLKQEVLQAQSADVQLISHATDTSEAFLQSLQGAVSQYA